MIVVLLVFRFLVGGFVMPYSSEVTQAEASQIGPTVEAHQNPLGRGAPVTLEEAKELWVEPLPVPPTNARTGEVVGIWSDGSQIAFAWSSSMRFYASRSSLSEEEAVRGWTQKVAEQPQEGSQLISVRGHAAIARDGSGEQSPTNITWIERGQTLQFVAPFHSLREVKAFAEAVRFEG